MKGIQIFKAGRHTSAGGQTLSFSESDIEATINAYDPALHEAPVVVGHPKDNGPAYGWVKSLSFGEGSLEADFDQVDPAFAELVEAGRFKKRSASFYAPDAPNNPVPGVFYLRHVGFLGAQPPAVKGLKDIQFDDGEEGVIEFADTSFVASIMAGIARRLREWIIAEKGVEEADKVIPSWTVSDLEAESRRPEPVEAAAPAFSEPGTGEPNMLTPEQIAELQEKAAKVDQLTADNEKLTAAVAEFKEREAGLVEREQAVTRSEVSARVETLVGEGKVLPKDKEAVTEFCMGLNNTDLVFEFGEGENAEKISQREQYLKQLEGRAPVVDYQERTPRHKGGNGEKSDREIAAAAISYQEDQRQKGIVISTAEAVDAVREGKAG